MTPSSKTLIYSLMLLSFSFIYSQNSSLKGIVIDGKTGQPIPGASLLLKENKKVQITNQEGSFIFSNIAIGKYILEVSAISFQTKENWALFFFDSSEALAWDLASFSAL